VVSGLSDYGRLRLRQPAGAGFSHLVQPGNYSRPRRRPACRPAPCIHARAACAAGLGLLSRCSGRASPADAS